MRDRGPADDRILWVDLADLPRRAVASPRRACARAVVNNAFKKIEAEYGEQSVGAEGEVFQRRQEPAAVSRTDVEAARSNWRTGQRGGDPEDSFKRGRGDAVDPDIRSSGPYFGCAAAQEPSASSPARASATGRTCSSDSLSKGDATLSNNSKVFTTTNGGASRLFKSSIAVARAWASSTCAEHQNRQRNDPRHRV